MPSAPLRHDLDEISGVPPALLLMLREFAVGGGWAAIRKRIRLAIRDMKDQSLEFERQNAARSESPSSLRFEVHPHGALDLLSGLGCMALNCRVAAAERLACSLGLIADRIWLTDHLSTQIITLGRASNDAIDQLMGDAMVLAPLLPLMQAGIVRFRSPWISTCVDCSAVFQSQVEQTTQAVLRSFGRQIKVERTASGYLVDTGRCFDPPMVMHSAADSDAEIPTGRGFAEYLVAKEVRQALWTAREATFTNGVVFSNSRVALAGMLECDGRLPRNRRDLRVFEDSRALDLPWVSELSPSQILQLREEAANAIPTFREMLARATTCSGSEPSNQVATDFIAELRAQAAEVRAELSAKKAKSARYWRTAYGVLGLGISAYGVASDQVLAGVGGLLPIIQLLIEHRTSHESGSETLKTRPGYVFVRAQDILAHSH